MPFLPRDGWNHFWYSLNLSMEGGPGWGGWKNTGVVDPPKVVPNPSTSHARRSLTSLMWRTLLPLCQTSHLYYILWLECTTENYCFCIQVANPTGYGKGHITLVERLKPQPLLQRRWTNVFGYGCQHSIKYFVQAKCPSRHPNKRQKKSNRFECWKTNTLVSIWNAIFTEIWMT